MNENDVPILIDGDFIRILFICIAYKAQRQRAYKTDKRELPQGWKKTEKFRIRFIVIDFILI